MSHCALVKPDGSILTDDHLKATLLNNHFASQSQLDADDRRNPLANTNNELPPTIETIEASPREVLNMLNSLDRNKSCG